MFKRIIIALCTLAVLSTAAGAVAALIYTDAARPDPISMDVQSATLPAIMVSYPDGADIKHRLAASPQMSTTLDFTIAARSVNSDRLADFTAKGPNVDSSIKPDLVAVGTSVYTAAQKTNSQGDLYSPDGYKEVDGTSFSSPIVAVRPSEVRVTTTGGNGGIAPRS